MAAMPAEWQREQVVVTTPITPSSAQIVAAVGSPVSVISLRALVVKLARYRPDILLLGCTGPVVHAILAMPRLRRGGRRPVLLTGLPGISIPATPRAVEFRAACDVFVVHSRRERADFARLGAALAPQMIFALARLPFLADELGARQQPERDRDVVFAAQAKVPIEHEHRRRILLGLAASMPGSGVVKLRASDGEEQTHRELWSYPQLWTELVSEGLVDARALRFSTGAMKDALEHAAGFVTVSSTAALEAIAAHVRVLILADFGVSADMINSVFEDSGCLGTLDDLRAGRFFTPGPQWLSDNYFHPPADSDWLDRVRELLTERVDHGLPPRALRPVGSPVALVRRQVRLLLPARWWDVISRSRRRLRAGAHALRRRGRTARGRLLGHPGATASAEPPPVRPGVHHGLRPASPPPAWRQDH